MREQVAETPRSPSCHPALQRGIPLVRATVRPAGRGFRAEARNDTWRRATLVLVIVLAATSLSAQPSTTGTLKVPDAAQFVGAPHGAPLTGAQLERRTNQIGGLIRCPVCQGMSVADSPAEMAVNMKGQVRELLERGYTEEQILKYFELSYGQFVLLKPKFEGVTAWVWLLPVFGLLIGGAVVFVTLRKLEAAPAAAPQPPAAADDPYLARVRDMVGGGKS